MAETYASIVAGCQVELEDYDGQLYTPSLLLRAVNLALEDVRLDLSAAGVAELRKEATVTLPASTTQLGVATTPALPADFSAPIEVYERPSGATSAAEWVPVRPVADLPLEATAGDSLGVYAFQAGVMRFVGALGARELKVDYLADLPDFASTADALPARMILAPLVYLTCAHLVRATAPAASADYRGDAARAMAKVRSVAAKRKQMEIAIAASRRGRAGATRFRPLIQ